MKKILILVLTLTALVFPLSAKSTLVNFGYTVQGKYLNFDDTVSRSIGVDFINLQGDSFGFYSQFNPYYTTSIKIDEYVYEASEMDYFILGSGFLFGYGGDLNFGKMGLLLGGGLFVNLEYFEPSSGDYRFTINTGMGLGANLYFQPGDGSFIINAGVTFALTPWGFAFSEDDSIDYTNWGMTNTNFNVGVGWRTGGIKPRAGKTASSGGSSGDDW
jgi:hypothetical protein